MNLLMLNYEYPPLGGGGGVVNKCLAEELAKRNQVTLITSRFENQRSYEVENGVEIIRVPVMLRRDRNVASIPSMMSFFPASLAAGVKLLNRRSFDVIHSLFAVPSAPSGVLLARGFGIPHIVSVLGGDVYDPSKTLSPHKTPYLYYTVKKVLKSSARIVGMSSDIVDRVIRYYGIRKNIELIPHSIKRPVFTRTSRNALGFEEDEVLLVTVGRLVKRKALDDLIRLIHRLGQSNPGRRERLVVIGEGPEHESLKEMAERLNVSKQVVFLGNVSEERKFQILAVSDAFLSTTRHEGFGLVFLEAMSVGLPVVCYDNGGQTDFLVDGKTGFLIPLDNLGKFTASTQALVENKPLRLEMSEYARRQVESYFIENRVAHYESLYEAVVRERLIGRSRTLPRKVISEPFPQAKKRKVSNVFRVW